MRKELCWERTFHRTIWNCHSKCHFGKMPIDIHNSWHVINIYILRALYQIIFPLWIWKEIRKKVKQHKLKMSELPPYGWREAHEGEKKNKEKLLICFVGFKGKQNLLIQQGSTCLHWTWTFRDNLRQQEIFQRSSFPHTIILYSYNILYRIMHTSYFVACVVLFNFLLLLFFFHFSYAWKIIFTSFALNTTS